MKDKKLLYLWSSRKNSSGGGGGSRKTNILGGLPEEGRLGQFSDGGRGRGLCKKERVVFSKGGLIPLWTILFCIVYCWTHGSSWKGPLKLGLSSFRMYVCLSFRPFACLGVFLELYD